MLTPTLYWENDALVIVDQTALPSEKLLLRLHTAEAVYEAIRSMKVRGAPAIGMAAAFGLYLGVRSLATDDPEKLRSAVDEVASMLASARPTAVNLAWAWSV